MASLQSVGAAIAERVGPIHINDAERGLLETIYLLLTSCICVPLVCKLIPGGSPVLGYLVRVGVAREQGGWGGAFGACADVMPVSLPPAVVALMRMATAQAAWVTSNGCGRARALLAPRIPDGTPKAPLDLSLC